MAQVRQFILSAPPRPSDDLAGIEGWLILPGIMLVIGLVLGAVKFDESFSLAVRLGYLFIHPAMWLKLSIMFLLLVLYTYVTMLFFQRKRHLPVYMITLLAGEAVLLALGFALSNGLYFAPQLLFATLRAAVGIPYFLLAKRVRATFVN